jgi:hypothetical protein
MKRRDVRDLQFALGLGEEDLDRLIDRYFQKTMGRRRYASDSTSLSCALLPSDFRPNASILLPVALERRSWKQKRPRRAVFIALIALRKFGAGEGIRTLDPNLGKRWEALLPISLRSDAAVFSY